MSQETIKGYSDFYKQLFFGVSVVFYALVSYWFINIESLSGYKLILLLCAMFGSGFVITFSFMRFRYYNNLKKDKE